MNLYILFSIIFAVICLTFQFPFLYAQRPGKCAKSLTLKMIAASSYLAVGLLMFRYFSVLNGSVDRFRIFMLAGLIASWLGDLFLHIPGKLTKKFFAVGMAFFLSAHILYILAFTFGQKDLLSDDKFLPVWGYIMVIAIIIFAIILLIVKKYKFGLIFVPFLIYGLILNTELTKALSFGLSAYKNGLTEIVGMLALIIGGLMFFMSDYSLAYIIAFDKKKEKFGLKIFNIVTYFVAQVLLAFSIIGIGG